jgi:hypothetical protein
MYAATHESIDDPFSAPVNLGQAVNTADKNETRPSLSWDARTLYFGRTPGPEGSTDIFGHHPRQAPAREHANDPRKPSMR